MASSGEEYLSVAEVAAALKLNPQTVRNMIDRGEIPAIRIGRRVRITRSDLEQVLEHGRIGAPTTKTVRSPAQAFWEGELQPTVVEPPEPQLRASEQQ